MTQHNAEADSTSATEVLREALKNQYHAALETLRQAVERCPQDLWIDAGYPNPFWHSAYHTLFFTQLYLLPNEAAFQPWEQHREEYQFMGRLPWPPHRMPKIGEPYTQDEVLSYWEICEALVDETVDGLDLNAPDCGFWWCKVSKAEHQIMNVRHIQHHTAQLLDRLRNVADIGVDWQGSRPSAEPSENG